ncbi:MAG TPA: MBL fold metallo-hydrolase, partial [Candidatus Ozemobacteraceae bacterium]|nr:MBL fold metallo-hydrolase [Candidatus Ozemobacteraceae bacterium]
ACRALLCETDDGRRLLFETGIGNFFEPKLRERFGVTPDHHQLLHELKALGIAPESITDVILSHLHFDHSGGVVERSADGALRLAFPKARFYVGETQWQRAIKPHARDKASYIPEINALLESSGRLVRVTDASYSDLKPLVTFSFSDGHTPGLMLSTLHLPKGPLVFVADLIPASPWINAAITMGYDRFPERLIEEKHALLTDLHAKNGALFFTHDPSMPFARITKDDKGRFVPHSITPADLV